MSDCCKTGFQWDGKAVGKESKIANLDTYITGSNKEAAVLIVHDVFGWTLNSMRLLADHYAAEADVTVYLPDFFGGEIVDPDTMSDPAKFAKFDLKAFVTRHAKEIRQPEIFAVAKALKNELGFKKVGAIGFCYGGWAVARLGAKGSNLVDAITAAHPSMITKEELANIGVPTQILAPETDPEYTPELKEYTHQVFPTLNIEYDYQFFPGLFHGFAARGDPSNPAQRRGVERAKNAVVYWFSVQLH